MRTVHALAHSTFASFQGPYKAQGRALDGKLLWNDYSMRPTLRPTETACQEFLKGFVYVTLASVHKRYA